MSSIQYEKETVCKMIRLYCRKKHNLKNGDLCDECDAVNEYAQLRLDKCPFGDEKHACEDCKIHCYKPDMRSKIREIMRFSGPRFLLYYPADFLRHIFKDKNKSRNTQRQKRGCLKRKINSLGIEYLKSFSDTDTNKKQRKRVC